MRKFSRKSQNTAGKSGFIFKKQIKMFPLIALGINGLDQQKKRLFASTN
jgi:hypothetical protein